MGTSTNWKNWRLTAAAVVLAVLALAVVWTLPQNRTERLLGIDLPNSVSDVHLDVEHYSVGEYRGYLRFNIATQDVEALIAENDVVQSHASNREPWAHTYSAKSGGVPVATVVEQEGPEWWNLMPDGTTRYRLAYTPHQPRSNRGGPDFAWYAIDVSDPARAIVYVYVIEV